MRRGADRRRPSTARPGVRTSIPGLLGAALVGVGCAGSAGPVPAGGTAAGASTGFRIGDPLVREIVPFPVRDAGGRAYDHPFLGGFDVPRPQLVDIDGDGDNDLFVQERTDELIFFENVGSPEAPRYEWRTSRYQ